MHHLGVHYSDTRQFVCTAMYQYLEGIAVNILVELNDTFHIIASFVGLVSQTLP
jgi:hypothetical protein